MTRYLRGQFFRGNREVCTMTQIMRHSRGHFVGANPYPVFIHSLVDSSRHTCSLHIGLATCLRWRVRYCQADTQPACSLRASVTTPGRHRSTMLFQRHLPLSQILLRWKLNCFSIRFAARLTTMHVAPISGQFVRQDYVWPSLQNATADIGLHLSTKSRLNHLLRRLSASYI